MSEGTRLKIFEFLATPAHIWLWVCAKLCGWDFEYWAEDEDDENEDTFGP